ncbi:MAG: TonB-dependent receptor [Bacteroidia bacterium]|nr:TonB-dependent receptor [Bacteroidia bacterium]
MKVNWFFSNLLMGLLFSVSLKAQCDLKASLKDADGKEVPFAGIQLKNTRYITQSNADGSFEISSLPCGSYTIQIRCLGYETFTDTIVLPLKQIFQPTLKPSNKNLEEVLVQVGRVEKNQGMAYSNMEAETIKTNNLGQDAPMLLNQLTGVVANSDAGNGIGYTGIRIRGSDGTRINVTVNGVPINDAESQGTFFVNMPDLLSSVNSVQVQRGVGTSVNGAGAFGASINFATQTLEEKPYAGLISTAGSFNTYRNTVLAGTGLIENKFVMDMRASLIKSDGYIDRASSDLRSYYLSAAYYKGKSVLKFINFYGKEKTYQAWYYVPEDSVKQGNRTYNMAGQYTDALGNINYYNNETDNYTQNNFQLHFIHQFSHKLHANITAHYTKGEGYYEQYKEDQNLVDYGLKDVITPSGDTITQSDMVRRLWLDNDFIGALFNITYRSNSRLQMVLGGGANTYSGAHFGRIMWSQYASNSSIDHEYYRNNANKSEGNLYLKTNFKPFSNTNLFVDLQVRKVMYSFLGFNELYEKQMQEVDYTFFNPKIGFNIELKRGLDAYVSVGVGNKEPNRDDFVQSTPQSRPQSEQLADLETGLNFNTTKVKVVLNGYYMQYKNQLVLNGEVNDVGAYNRVNVPESRRMGLELDLNYKAFDWFIITGNFALSDNTIAKFTEYLDSSNADYSVYKQVSKEYVNTDISFSPSTVSSLVFTFLPVKNFKISLINKNVGRQYLDNTSNLKRSLDPYSVFDLNMNYSIKTKVVPEMTLMLTVYNLLNTQYLTNGYTYSYYYDSAQLSTFNFVAPAAPINFLAGISIKF